MMSLSLRNGAGRTPPAEYDAGLAWTSLVLLALGLVMVYSSSIATAEASRFTGGQASYFRVRHALFLTVAIVAAMLVFQMPMRLWQKFAPWLFLLVVALIIYFALRSK